jgi:hypothetical protein
MRAFWLAPALAAGLAVALVTAAAPAASAQSASAQPAGTSGGAPIATSTLYEDSFAGTDTPAGSWTTVSTAGGGGPCLTAASGSTTGGIPVCPGGATAQPGSGMLQLTDNGGSESGYVISNNPVVAKDGAHISFDMSQYDAKQSEGRGGDGLSFFLVDGSIANPTAGNVGGALGYNGLQGAILGVGFDEYGNFSTTRFGGAGGPGVKPNSVVVRGAASTSYSYVTGVQSPKPLAVDTAKTNTAAVRHVSIDITGGMLNVSVSYGNGAQPVRVIGPLNLASISGQPQLPPTFKYGFSASTGTATAYHTISNLTVSGLAPQLGLTVSHQGTFTAGAPASYQLAVSNSQSAGPTIAPVTVSLPVPAGYTVTSASGTGWTCGTASATVTCTRPGTGGDTLQPGTSYPPVTVGVAIPAGPAGSVTVTGTAKTSPGPADGVNATDTAPVAASPVQPAGPDLSMAVAPQGTFTAGGTGGYQLTVSDAPAAGPTTGTVTATFPVPAGQTVTSATGPGWTCTTSGQTVTCTRPGSGSDALQPASSYPPVTISTSIPSSATGTVPVTATATTPGNADPNGAEGKVTVSIEPAPVVAPSLSMAVTPQGTFAAGGTGSYQLLTSNAPAAGPTTGTVTATFPVPAGQTVTSVTGPGWTCTTSGQTVTCTRPGSGPDSLAGGASYPPVTINVQIPSSASGMVPVTATANTPGNADPDGGQGKATVTIGQAQTAPQAPGPDLSMTVTPQGEFTAGGSGGYQLIVSDAPEAGPTAGKVTATFPVPAGQTVTSATGVGWMCATSGQTVTCTRPGTGDDALQPGSSYPPVMITSKIPSSATGPLPVTATANTPGNADPNGAQGKTTVSIAPAPVVAPALSMTVTPQGTFTAGSTGGYQLTVSNAPAAGPTTGKVTATFPVPAGQTVTSANGPGWTCGTSGQTVTCTRPGSGDDMLQPGSSYPPVTITTSIPSSASGVVPVTATASTPGNADPNGGEGKATVTIGQAQTAPATGPALSMAVTPQGSFTAGGTGSYQLTVSNAPSAGPTAGKVTATFNVPAGQTVTGASGSGWTCDISGQAVSCTRPGNGSDALQPGSSYPPVTIATTIASSASGAVNVTVGVNTPGDVDPDGAQGQATVIIAPAPSPGSVICRGGNIETTIGPGITFQTKTVQMTGQGDTGQCQSPSDPTISSGTFTFQATGQGACPNGLDARGTGVIIWNNGQTSSIAGTAVLDQNQVGAVTMHVTKGEFAGDSGTFAGPITYLPWYNCLTPNGVEYGRGIINEGFLNP